MHDLKESLLAAVVYGKIVLILF